ncbi:uncharacterized protein [Typha latifolia]|uniref:uncharacterized protein isoform X3 n=1 Tax=Typha latifolia TaxID=4733 RepID=UPI003C2F6B77
MQERILYKGICDNKINEISERVSADRCEKYEDKYKQVGDVASKLTIEEATFCDIQEKMLELCNAIIKMQKSRSPGDLLQDPINQIQSNLEELVKSPNEQCKHYGLRAKPTSLIELPFGTLDFTLFHKLFPWFKKKAMIVGTTELHTPSQELLYYFASTFFPGEPI